MPQVIGSTFFTHSRYSPADLDLTATILETSVDRSLVLGTAHEYLAWPDLQRSPDG